MEPSLESKFKAAISVDNVVFGFDSNDLKVLLIYRGAEPYKECWALPGDLISLDQGLDESAEIVLQELISIS